MKNPTLNFMRIIFVLLSVFFMTVFKISCPATAGSESCFVEFPIVKAIEGVLLGLAFGAFLIACDHAVRRFNLRSFNIVILGIFIGYLMGTALVLVLDAILIIGAKAIHLSPETLEMVKVAFFLFGIYFGTYFTMKASDELYMSIPFVKFTATSQKKKDLLIDASVLSDPRIISMAQTHLFDHMIVLPGFVIKELYSQIESGDDNSKKRAKNALDNLKQLEAMSSFGLRINATDYGDLRDPKNPILAKCIRLARTTDSHILTASSIGIDQPKIEDVEIINLNSLTTIFKAPVTNSTEMELKIQHAGKGTGQGVAYLEDGSMVVVNGAADMVHQIVRVSVIQEKTSKSGRMIFCNLIDS